MPHFGFTAMYICQSNFFADSNRKFGSFIHLGFPSLSSVFGMHITVSTNFSFARSPFIVFPSIN